ncbi:alpha-mannosidase [bacterium]|nr:MAG: alpha-mannosidase [bacterium]
MKVTFTVEGGDETAILRTRLERVPSGAILLYRWPSGALLRQDGEIRGAFDREHRAVTLRGSEGGSDLTLEVERHGLPGSGLPSGPGLRWRWMQRERAIPLHGRVIVAGNGEAADPPRLTAPAAIGHAHLDVAWLWTTTQARRKFVRTLSNQARYLEDDPNYVFAQSQPQLCAWLEHDDAALFANVRTLAAKHRIDASVAAMWVEPDCHAASGESLLRQLVLGRRYAREVLATEAEVCWLPDTFGFPSTLPMLLQHAGVPYFYTTKLRWNERTRFPYSRWWWESDDGSRVLAVLGASYEGAPTADRVAEARIDETPLVVGYGDGGGGPTRGTLARVREAGLPWSSAAAWFAGVAARDGARLPTYRDELYLECHRGTYTSNALLKAENAALEFAIGNAEEQTAWCASFRVAQSMLRENRKDLDAAWRVLLTNQFHDLLAGTSIGAATEEALEGYAQARKHIEASLMRCNAVLPRGGQGLPSRGVEISAPLREGRTWLLDNGLVRARIDDEGAVIALEAGGRNVVRRANVLRAFVDRPKTWEAWNLDADYRRQPRELGPASVEGVRDGVVVRRVLGDSEIVQHLSLQPGESWLRVGMRIAWHERRTILRVEHTFEQDDERALFGQPHGVLTRPVRPTTEAERAKFEVPGQRFCSAAGCAVFATDRYGWSLGSGAAGGVEVGLSLLRGTTWPDPDADLGEHVLEYALVPHGGASVGELERAWREFSEPRRPHMVKCEAPNVLIAAVKLADDCKGVIVRLRECDGVAGDVPLEVATRPLGAELVDAEERSVDGGELTLEDRLMRVPLRSYGLASVRVRFPIKDI